MGKTRLLAEIATQAEARGLFVLRGGCQRRSDQEPYAPVAAALAQHVRRLPPGEMYGALKGAHWLVRMLPELGPFMAGKPPADIVPSVQERRLIFGAVTHFIANISHAADVLLLLDDLQWASGDGLDLLAAVAMDAASTSIRVIGAYRDTDLQHGDPLGLTLADLAQAGLLWQHTLRPLNPDEARQLLAGLLDGMQETDRGLIERVAREMGGVPFFLVSYAQQACMTARERRFADDVPWSIAHSVLQRAAALPETAQNLLRLASVVGRRAPRTLLAAVSDKPEPEVLSALDTACRAQLLLLEDSDTYQFVHDVIREVIEEDLGAAQRAVLHRSIAQVLEQAVERVPIEDLAYHYARSDDQDKALLYLGRAADRARSAGAHQQEAALLAEAAAIAERGNGRGDLGSLHSARGRALASMTRWTEAAAEMEIALQKLSGHQPEARAEMLIDLSEVTQWLSDVPSARRYAIEALALAEKVGRNDLSARALGMLAEADSCDGDLSRSLQRFDEAFARAGPEGLAYHASDLELAGMIHYWMGNFTFSIQRSREAVAAGRESFNTRATARALANIAAGLMGQGRYDDALNACDEARIFAREHDTGGILARAIAMQGGLHLELFNFPTAEALAEEAREVSRSSKWLPPRVSAGIDLVLNFARRGDVARAEALISEVAESVADARGAHGWLWAMRLEQARAELALARREWEQAIRWTDGVLHSSRLTGRVKYQALGLGTRAKALASLGRKREAIAALHSAVAMVRPVGDPVMFLWAAAALLPIDGDDALLAEANAAMDAVTSALPNEALVHAFQEAALVR